jgi:spore maturation protein CgeB
MMKKVLIVGQTQELGRTEEVYGRGFSAFGCKVQYFNWSEASASLSSSALTDKIAWRLAWQLMANPANQKLIEIANQFQPNLTFVVSPLWMKPSTIKALQKHGLVFAFFTDNPLDSHHTHSNAWVRKGLPMWDAVFIWSQELANKLAKQGINKVFYHPFCSDVEYHFPSKQNNLIYDVAFIGNWDSSRKREQYLKAISHYRLAIWGSDYWITHCRETSIRNSFKGMCTYQEVPEILGSAKIGLNILRPQNESGHNIRTFEIPAARTLMLSERSRDLLELFEEDKEAVYFSTPEDLQQKIKYLLDCPDLIQSIANAGYKKALKHTINNRMTEINYVYKQFFPLHHYKSKLEIE